MNYQDTVKSSIKRTQIRLLILLTLLALICGAGAYSLYHSGTSVMVLELFSIPSTITSIIFLILCLLLVYVDAQTLGSLLRGKIFADLLENVKKFGNPDTIFEHIGQLPKSKLCSSGDFRFDEKYTAFLLSDLVILQPTQNIVWGYIQEKSSKSPLDRASSVKTRQPQNVILRMKNRSAITLRTRSKEDADQLLNAIQECNPRMTVGYSVKYESLYGKNPENLRKSGKQS